MKNRLFRAVFAETCRDILAVRRYIPPVHRCRSVFIDRVRVDELFFRSVGKLHHKDRLVLKTCLVTVEKFAAAFDRKHHFVVIPHFAEPFFDFRSLRPRKNRLFGKLVLSRSPLLDVFCIVVFKVTVVIFDFRAEVVIGYEFTFRFGIIPESLLCLFLLHRAFLLFFGFSASD